MSTLHLEPAATPRRRSLIGRGIVAGAAAAAAMSLLVAPAALADDDDDVTDAAGDDEVVPFPDAEDSVHGESVAALNEEGIIQGCTDEWFCTDELVTRGQFASMLAIAADVEPATGGFFTDLDGNVHGDNIVAAAAAGIVAGCSEQEFCAEDPITREQLSTMLVNAFDVPPTDENFFDDLSSVHGPNVNALAAAGFAAGCGEPLTHFCSTDHVNRGQAATFLARAAQFVEGVTVSPLEERRAEQEAIDAERARIEAERQAEEERLAAERRAEEERLAAERALEDERRVSAERLAMWESLAQCESNGRWDINTGNGYYGGLQFHIQTWRSVGGSGYPHQASKTEQIYRAELLLQQPWATFGNQWPACSRRLGLSGT